MESPPDLEPTGSRSLRSGGPPLVHPLVDLAVWQLIVALPYFTFESFIAGVPFREIGADIMSGAGIFFFLFVNPTLWATGYFYGLPTRDHPQGLWIRNWKRLRLTDAILKSLWKKDPADTPRYHGDIWRD